MSSIAEVIDMFCVYTATPTVFIATENMTFAVNDKVSLLCKIQNTKSFVTAKWMREENQQVLNIANFSYDGQVGQTYHRFYHTINKVSTADSGTYICEVNYYYGILQVTYKLRVRGK